MIDIALILDKLIPQAQYGGSLTSNTKESYELLRWEDSRQKPTWEQIEAQWIIVNKELNTQSCKNKAKQLISNTDWSVLPDVNITNKSEFESYRSIIRNYIINPIENPEFPIEPQPIWSVE